MSLQTELELVLDLAQSFSTTATPEMRARDEGLRRVRNQLQRHVRTLQPFLAPELRLQVEEGGRRGSYGPLPWVRVFSPAHSRNATAGFYLVYLFAADGSRVYLSLNQGTSEWRYGKMRPVTDSAEIRAVAKAERRRLVDFETTPLMDKVERDIDLAPEKAPGVGPESRSRIRNYQDANIVARAYRARSVPKDEILVQDLSDFIPLLRRLYRLPELEELTWESPRPRAAAVVTRSRVQGRVLDPAVRRAIGVYAEAEAEKFLRSTWDDVTPVGHLHLGYDIECRSAREMLHVEVKGSLSAAEDVSLTRNEVHHLPSCGGTCPAKHALLVVAHIEVDRAAPITCSGGQVVYLPDWEPPLQAFTPTGYSFAIPKEARVTP